MKKLVFTALLFISMGTMAFAQQEGQKRERKTPEQKAQRLTDALDQKLALTADQKSKVYAISLEGLNNWKAQREKGEKPDKAAMKAELEKRDAQISALLNEQQKRTYQEWKVEKMKSLKNHKKGDHRKDKV